MLWSEKTKMFYKPKLLKMCDYIWSENIKNDLKIVKTTWTFYVLWKSTNIPTYKNIILDYI